MGKLEKLKKAGKALREGFQEVQNIAGRIEAETGLGRGVGDYVLGGRGEPEPKKKKKKGEKQPVTINIRVGSDLIGLEEARDALVKKKKG